MSAPSSLDLDALEQVQAASADRVKTIRTRAEKWIPALTSISGLLAVVLIVKGPESALKIPEGWRIVVALAFSAALFLFARATLKAYSAAFGGSDSADFDPKTTTGLHARLLSRRIQDEKDAKAALDSAIRSLLAGVMVLALGIGVSWFALPEASNATTVCIGDEAGNTVEIAGEPVTIKANGLTVEPCP